MTDPADQPPGWRERAARINDYQGDTERQRRAEADLAKMTPEARHGLLAALEYDRGFRTTKPTPENLAAELAELLRE